MSLYAYDITTCQQGIYHFPYDSLIEDLYLLQTLLCM